LIPKDKNKKELRVTVQKEGAPAGDLGGYWSNNQNPGSTGSYAAEGEARSGSGPAGHYQGTMSAGGWGGCATNLTAGNKPVDLSAYEAVEFYVKGKGQFAAVWGQPSIADYDYYTSDTFKPTSEWKLVRVPFKGLKQGGWGKPKPFTQNQVLSLSFGVRVASWPEVPEVCYNAMIVPLTPYKIRGALWYQGESNAGRPSQYHALLSALIRGWREAWKEGDFPFLIVQLPNFMAVKPEPQESGWAELREAQAQTAQDVPATGFVTTIDLGEANNIHPKNKTDVGKRLSLLALATVYKKDAVYSGPVFDSLEEKDGKVTLSFKHVGGGLMAKGGKGLKGFAMAGDDHKFYWAKAEIKGDTVEVKCDKVRHPMEVRYAWADNPVCNLYNKDGFPATPFRAQIGGGNSK
jgi:hypothetical protein